MLRVNIYSKDNSFIQQIFIDFFQKEHLDYTISSYQENIQQDIYIFEIQQKEDLELIEKQPHFNYALYYVIGPRDYDLISECMKQKVNFYFSKETFEEEFKRYETHILQDIQERFQYYTYHRNGIITKIRLSHIYYIEALRHQIIIHSINGTLVERKNLNAFLNTIQSSQFIQIHKSFIVNKQWIQKVCANHILLKNAETLQIGRAYKNNIRLL